MAGGSPPPEPSVLPESQHPRSVVTATVGLPPSLRFGAMDRSSAGAAQRPRDGGILQHARPTTGRWLYRSEAHGQPKDKRCGGHPPANLLPPTSPMQSNNQQYLQASPLKTSTKGRWRSLPIWTSTSPGSLTVLCDLPPGTNSQ